MQNNMLSFWEICSLLKIKNISESLASDSILFEREYRNGIKNANSLSLSTQRREETRFKRGLNKNVIVISVIAQRCEILYTVLGRWTSKLHTPLKLTNGINYKWSNTQIMGKRPLNVTKNRKVLWSVIWLSHEKLNNVTKIRKVLWLITW